MRFAVVGGDGRAARLAELLLRDGHRVRSFALEKAALPAEIPRDGCLHSCVYGADCVLLPCPAEKGGFLNAPLSAEELPAAELVEAMWPGQLLLGGRFSEETVTAALRGKLQVADLLRRQELAVGNAALTAEGAVEKLIANSDRSLWGGRVLVLGWGRIGSLLALRLRALDYEGLESVLGDFDFIVNTVPARVLREGMLCLIRPDALLLELASPPGGFDRTLAANIGLRTLAAPGLPGETAPLSAALLLQKAVYAAIEEMED